jgi:hypothetical protein
MTTSTEDYLNKLESRLRVVEDALQTLPEVKRSIRELDELIKTITRTNKELLYILQKGQLKDRDNVE